MLNICRLCLNSIYSKDYILIGNENDSRVTEKLRTCIPEIEIELVEESVVCYLCVIMLNKFYDFKYQCLQSEEHICSYIKNAFPNMIEKKLTKLYPEIIKDRLCNDYNDDNVNMESKVYDLYIREEAETDIEENDIKNINLIEMENVETENLGAVCSSELSGINDSSIPMKSTSEKQLANLTDLFNPTIKSLCASAAEDISNEQKIEPPQFPILPELLKETDKSNLCTINSNLKKVPSDTVAVPLLQRVVNKDGKTYTFYSNKFLLLNNFKRPSPTTNVEQKRFKCTSCDYKSNSNFSLQEHIRTHTGKKPFICETCDRAFARKHYLDIHSQVHTGEKPFTCKICNKGFAFKQTLKLHMNTHSGEKPFKCDLCDYTCSRKATLKVHIKIHTKEKLYECDICQCKFTTKERLRIHGRIHLGDKPFLCDICGYACTERGSLIKHLLIHTGVKPYKCTFCDKQIRTSSALRIHLRSHTGVKPYECDSCGKKFSSKELLKRHIRIHTGEKPFKCHLCNYRCAQSQQLQYHTRTHTAEKSFNCEICDYSCTRKTLYQKHVKIHS